MELMHFYAQVDADGFCFAVTCHATALPESPQLIKLDTYDESLLGKTYADGAWLPN